MDIRKLKLILAEQLDLEDELYDFCIDCLKKIYGKDADIAIYDFEGNYNHRHDYGCIQPLESIDHHVKNTLKERAQRKSSQSDDEEDDE